MAGTPKTRHTSIPAPTGGLNDRDNLAAMKPTDAVVLDNWWCYPSFVGIRRGSQSHSTGFTDPVETLVEYLPTSGVAAKFAVAGDSIFDATSTGPVGAAMVTGLSNARFQEVAITTSGGSFLYLLNGMDDPQLWDGSAWQAVDGVSVPISITGVTTNKLVQGCLFKKRLFFVEVDSMNVWYLPVDSVGGVAAVLPMGSIFRLGGSVTACYTWTIDAGNGADDHFVIISTNGEVAVYAGTDPSSASTWNLIGNFVLGKPLGRRCGIKFGGDLAINCMEGVFPLGKGLLSSAIDRRVALTDKIQNSVSVAASLYSPNFGWQLCLYPDANMLLLNIPAGNGVNYQFAQNTITGSWCRFSGWNAQCFLNAVDGLFFGDDTEVRQAWVTDLDGDTPITADVCQAFSYFGSMATNKYFTMLRPYIQATGNPSILYDLNTDFVLSDPTGILNYSAPTGMYWGAPSMVWGAMVWGGGLAPLLGWNTVGEVCNSAAVRMKIQNNGSQVLFTNSDFVYQMGGVL